MSRLFPGFLKLQGRSVLLVGGGEVAAAKLRTLLAAGASVRVVAPDVRPEIQRPSVRVERREFREEDLDGVWFAVSAAPPEVNRQVAAAAESRRVFVIAVDDPATATAYAGGVVRRGGVTVAISTGGDAPGLAGLLREALQALLPDDVGAWLETARSTRARWKEEARPMSERRPLLLAALNRLYQEPRP